MPVKDLYYKKYLKYKNKYINLQSQIGGVNKYTGIDTIHPDLVARGSNAYPFPDKKFARLFGNQSQDVQELVIEKVDEMPISRLLNRNKRDSIDEKTFTSLKKKLRLDTSIEKEAMFILSPITVYDPDYLDNNEILMLAKIFIENSDKPNMTPLITYMTLSPVSVVVPNTNPVPIQLVNASNKPLNFDLTKLKEFIFDTSVDEKLELRFDRKNYLNDNQLHFELFFIFICILITNKQIKLRFTSIDLHIYKKSFNTIIFGLKQNIIIELNIGGCQIGYEEATLLANVLEKNTTLITLDIYANNIGIEGAIALASALEKNRTLENISLSGNKIGDGGATVLASALEKTTISSLIISYNNIGDKGATELANALDKNTTLLNLNLSYNKIGIEGAMALANALKKNVTLGTLYFYHNDITEQEYDILKKLLNQNRRFLLINNMVY
jgi:Ran GTPase-activating protein (RanGAP) involved in mRNA processing and transport